MRSRGWVSYDADTELYALGLGLVELSAQALETIFLRDLARPHLEELWSVTGEAVHLGLLYQQAVLYAMKYETRHSVRMYSHVGRRAPLYCTGLGKAILAWMDDAARDAYLTSVERIRWTTATLVDADALLADLAAIRERGYAIDNAEHEDFVRCVAAPILDAEHHPIGAISIAAPVFRLTPERTVEWGRLVSDHCHQLSQRVARSGVSRMLDA